MRGKVRFYFAVYNSVRNEAAFRCAVGRLVTLSVERLSSLSLGWLWLHEGELFRMEDEELEVCSV